MLTDQQQTTVHDSSINNRGALETAPSCGCFFCLKMFPPAEIAIWVDRATEPDGVTAVCPYCGVDAVIPSTASGKFGPGLLSAMKDYWFS